MRVRVLSILVLLVVFGGCGGSDDPADRATSETEPRRTQTQRETPAREDDGEPAEATPLQITHERVDSLGTPATSVTALGPLQLSSGATLEVATRALGRPDSSGPGNDDPNVCAATWLELGLTLQFYFGHPPSPERSCAEGPVAGAYMTGARWVTEPGGLRVGDDASSIRAAHPRARATKLPVGLARQVGIEDGWVLERGAYGGDPFPTLFAAVRDDRIAALIYVSGAD